MSYFLLEMDLKSVVSVLRFFLMQMISVLSETSSICFVRRKTLIFRMFFLCKTLMLRTKLNKLKYTVLVSSGISQNSQWDYLSIANQQSKLCLNRKNRACIKKEESYQEMMFEISPRTYLKKRLVFIILFQRIVSNISLRWRGGGGYSRGQF